MSISWVFPSRTAPGDETQLYPWNSDAKALSNGYQKWEQPHGPVKIKGHGNKFRGMLKALFF